MSSILSKLIFETLVVSLLFSALCLIQITENQFQWTHFCIAAMGSLFLYGFKRIAALFVKRRPNSPHYLVLTSAGLILLLCITMEHSLFGLLHSIGLLLLYCGLLLSKTALFQSHLLQTV